MRLNGEDGQLGDKDPGFTDLRRIDWQWVLVHRVCNLCPSFPRPSASTFLLRVEGCLKRAWFQYPQLLQSSSLVKHLSPFRALFRAKFLPRFPDSQTCTTPAPTLQPSTFLAFPARGSPFPIPSHPSIRSNVLIYCSSTLDLSTPIVIWTYILQLLPPSVKHSTHFTIVFCAREFLTAAGSHLL